MTAYFIDLTEPRKRALIASDSLSYTVTGDRHRPLGFASKVINLPHLRGALIGSGIYELHVAAAATLMGRPELMTHGDVVDALPEILQEVTERLADERGIADPDGAMLLAAGWIGFNDEAGKFELVIFENYKDSYAPRPAAAPLIGIPNVPPQYVPAGFTSIADPAVRAMAGLRAIGKFAGDHVDDLGMAPIGGEIVLTELRPDGVSTKVVGRLPGFETLPDEIAATWADVFSGGDYSGLDLVNRTSDSEAALQRLQRTLARRSASEAPAPASAGMTERERRAAEKRARKANRRRAA